MFSVKCRFRGRVGLRDRKYSLVSIKVIDFYEKSPQFPKTNECVSVSACVCGLWEHKFV